MKNLGLYIHIPFCQKKCNYCDFYSLSLTQSNSVSSYVENLITHMLLEKDTYKDCNFDTVFFGGGTPSVLTNAEFEKIFDVIYNNFSIDKNAEISIEANPGTLDKEKLTALKNLGVNRISLGLQSSFDEDLKYLGRIHTLKEFEENYYLAREIGFDNINIDIMYALPHQNKADFIKTLDYVVQKSPEHISSYCLKIEKNTPFYKMVNEKSLPNEDMQYEMYLDMCNILEKNGYEQYEISNFAKQGKRCRHNMKYWLSEEYVSFGPSAHSYFNGTRYSYEGNIHKYIEPLKKGFLPEKVIEKNISICENEKRDEYIMLKMRLCDGISNDEFVSLFGISIEEAYPQINDFIKSGHIEYKNSNYHFTKQGFFVSNYILSTILFND